MLLVVIFAKKQIAVFASQTEDLEATDYKI